MDAINSLLDFSKICRLCLSQDQPLFKIFIDDENLDFQNSMSSKIMACVSIEMEPGDSFPDQICIRCIDQIENWERFKALCDNTTSFLLQYITEISPLSDEVLENNLQECDTEHLDIPSTPSNFSFADVSLLEHDSLLQKIDETEEENFPNTESVISGSFSNILNKSHENTNKYPSIQVKSIENCEEDAIREGKKQKWREKYARCYRKKYNCDLCYSVFTKFSKLLEHDRVEHKDIVGGDVCPQCNQVFISNYRLEVHIKIKHKEKIFSCDICGLSSVSKKSLEVHKLRHSGRFVCNVCGVAKSTSRSLQDHVRSHGEDKSFQCNTCQRSFKQKQSLEHHLKTHNPHLQSDFQCNICSKKFKSVHYLNTHKTTHSTENLAICDVCGKTFKNKHTLYIHKLNHKEKKHLCMVCDKTFTTKNLLSRHLLTHGPRNIVCTICGKSFNRDYSLRKHMKTHSNNTSI